MGKEKYNIVSYQIAKLLKKYGFSEDVYFRIYPDGSIATSGFLSNYNSHDTEAFSAPTLSEVIDWFYEKFDIFIEIDYIRIPYNFGKKFKYFIIDISDDSFGGDILLKSDDAFETRNEAIFYAVKKLLENLKTFKKLEEQNTNTEKETFIFEGIEIKVKKEQIEVM